MNFCCIALGEVGKEEPLEGVGFVLRECGVYWVEVTLNLRHVELF